MLLTGPSFRTQLLFAVVRSEKGRFLTTSRSMALWRWKKAGRRRVDCRGQRHLEVQDRPCQYPPLDLLGGADLTATFLSKSDQPQFEVCLGTAAVW